MASEKSLPAEQREQSQRPVVPVSPWACVRNHQAWVDVGRREEMVLQQATGRTMMDPCVRLRDNILLRMRTDAEGDALKYDVKNFKGSEAQLDDLIRLHCNVCEQSERLRDVACFKTSPDSLPLRSGPLRSLPWGQLVVRQAKHEYWRHTLLMQPLFRAVFMVLVRPNGTIPLEPQDIKQIPNMHVQLILTGITEGLSAPISFEELHEYSIGGSPYKPGDQTITTTLSIATKFILRLEQREIAAFGIQPNLDSLLTDISPPWILKYREKAKLLGWVEERDGSLDNLSLRSSEWVDQPYTEDWWWNPGELPESAARNDEVCKRITKW
ncbi:hypothetical protein F4859DRAFT_519741 [Xylaria cf. heliscus]|nr:hypothetical protein F4859DRAFT_519741 [Xylaria cf. heliscus]